jgi:hypothetical protein
MLSSKENANKTIHCKYPPAAQCQHKGLLMPSAGYTWDFKMKSTQIITPMSLYSMASILLIRRRITILTKAG